MINAKTILLDQLLANANDRSWYISFDEAVDGLTEEEAFWKPDESSHSIAEIVQHLIFGMKRGNYGIRSMKLIPVQRRITMTLFLFEMRRPSLN